MRPPLFLAALLGCCFSCDGRYTLGDVTDTTARGGVGGQRGGAPPAQGGSSGAPTDAGRAGEITGFAGEAGAAGSGVVDGFRISPSSLPEARLNRGYVVQFAASGGVEPYDFSVEDGSLPTGLALDDAGRLSGTPLTEGQFDFTLEVEDAQSTRSSATFRLLVARSRWLASGTFPATSSSQTLLSLTDLHDATRESIRVESQSAHAPGFSPDGRWLTYYSFRSSAEVDWYIVDTLGAEPSPRQLLLTTAYDLRCSWAPDSSKLACPQQSADAHELVYFDTSGVTPGPAVTLGTATRFAFVGADELVFADGDAEYSRVIWSGKAPQQPEPLGLSAVSIRRQSPDGERALVVGADEAQSLVNLRTGEARPLPPGLLISYDFDSAVSTAVSSEDSGQLVYSFYALDGLDWTLVGEQTGAPSSLSGESLPLAGNRMTLIQGKQISRVEIRATGIEVERFAGEFEEVRRLSQSADGNWLYVETGARAANQQWLPASARHWLSQVGEALPAQLIAEEFLGGKAAFSADARRLYLHGYDSHSEDVVPFLLFDLASAEPVPHTLDIPLNWAESQWSGDGSFVSFIGGSPTRSSRPLFIVDALNPTEQPRIIFECSSNPAPLPGCPNTATFQP